MTSGACTRGGAPLRLSFRTPLRRIYTLTLACVGLALCMYLALTGRAMALAGAKPLGSILAEPLGTVEEFPFGRDPRALLGEIALDQEGNVWLVEPTNYLGFNSWARRISPNGITTGEVFLPGVYPMDIAKGPEDDMWLTDAGNDSVNRITPTGTITPFPIPNSAPKSFPEAIEGTIGIAEGAEGYMWFTDDRPSSEGDIIIGYVTPAGVIRQFPVPTGSQPDIPEYSAPWGIALGADGNMWFTDMGYDKEGKNLIGRITPEGTITEFPIPTPYSGPNAIALGPDGNMWFTEVGASKIGRITPAGVITEFPAPDPSYTLNGLTLGGDGDMWYTGGPGPSTLAWISPTGAVRDISTTSMGGISPGSIASGAHDQIWFTDPRPTSIAGPNPSFVGHFTAPPTPANLTLPALSGNATMGQALSVSEGSWSNGATVTTYQWQRCDSAGFSCQNLNGEVAAAHYLSTADVGHALRVAVTAENAVGPATAYSNLSPPIEPAAPEPPPVVPRPPSPRRPETVGGSVTWRFVWHARYTVVKSLRVSGLPAGAFVEVTCTGSECPFARSRPLVPTAVHRVCHRGRCKLLRSRDQADELSLAARFKGGHLKAGTHISVSIVKTGSTGRAFLFATRNNKAPSVNIVCLTPGSTTTETSCQ
jgi:streptogramin lyase